MKKANNGNINSQNHSAASIFTAKNLPGLLIASVKQLIVVRKRFLSGKNQLIILLCQMIYRVNQLIYSLCQLILQQNQMINPLSQLVYSKNHRERAP